MSYIDEVGEKLAREVLAARDELDNPNIVNEIAEVIEASSSKLHEAFMTAVRVYDADVRARKLLAVKLQAGR